MHLAVGTTYWNCGCTALCTGMAGITVSRIIDSSCMVDVRMVVKILAVTDRTVTTTVITAVVTTVIARCGTA